MKINVAAIFILFLIAGSVVIGIGTLNIVANDETLGQTGIPNADGSINNADGSVTQPDGTVTYPDNTTTTTTTTTNTTTTTTTTSTGALAYGTGSARMVFGAVVGDNTWTIPPTEVLGGSIQIGEQYLDDIKLYPRISTQLENIDMNEGLNVEILFKCGRLAAGLTLNQITFTSEVKSGLISMRGPDVASWQVPISLTTRALLGFNDEFSGYEDLTFEDALVKLIDVQYNRDISAYTSAFYFSIYYSIDARIIGTSTNGEPFELSLKSPEYRLELKILPTDTTAATDPDLPDPIGGYDPKYKISITSLHGPETDASLGWIYIIVGAVIIVFSILLISLGRRR